jgi:hypothetical protein
MIQIEVFSITALRHLVQSEKDAFALLTAENPTDVCRDLALFRVQSESGELIRVWTSANDTASTRRVVLRLRENFFELTPRQANRILDRCYNFVELCGQTKVFVPHNWNSFQGPDEIFMYFAAARNLVSWKPRWTAKRLPGNDVMFWDLYPSDENRKVEEETIDLEAYHLVVSAWADLVERGKNLLASSTAGHQDEVRLQSIHHSAPGRPRSYDEWMIDGQLAPDQRRFVLQSSEGSVRLKGPAGSGKTLALELKSIREARRLLAEKEDPRILFATHSNAMQEQVMEELYLMDGNGDCGVITVAPLLEVIRSIRPPHRDLRILGADYEEGLEWQLLTLDDCLSTFIGADWVKYENGCTSEFQELVRNWDGEEDSARLFRRDLINEFSVVMGGEGIQTGPGDRERYFKLERSRQWMPLRNVFELGSVFEIYNAFLRRIRMENYVTTDQFMLTSLNWLRSFEWGTLRSDLGYDVMLVDELHLFSQLERSALNHLGRNPDDYPVLYMSLDPHQSPTGRYGSYVEDRSLVHSQDIVELREIFRYSPQILNLIKHIDNSLPAENFGDAWSVNISESRSRADSGPIPAIVRVDMALNSESTLVLEAAQKLQSTYDRVAVIAIDEGEAKEFLSHAERLADNSPHVYPVRDRDETNIATKARRCLTVGLADHLAGLQFDAVIVAGFGDTHSVERIESRRVNYASRLYLAVSRSSREVRIFLGMNPMDDPSVIKTAIENQVVTTL